MKCTASVGMHVNMTAWVSSNWFTEFVLSSFAQAMMVNNYEQNVASLAKKLKNVTGLLEQKVHIIACHPVLLPLKYSLFVLRCIAVTYHVSIYFYVLFYSI